MQPFDIVNSAKVPGEPGLYVLGCYDSRITFCAQQIRALELAHALLDQGLLRKKNKIAVVGAGAAGVTAAAALALLTEASVFLFERADEVMPLQRDATRRRLDPYIYDWPAIDTDSRWAGLPILDWEAGSAKTVRQSLKTQLEQIVTALSPRLKILTKRTVSGIESAAGAFKLSYEENPGPAVSKKSDTFDLVVLAIGFGMEPSEALKGAPTPTYWADAGVPVPEFGEHAIPRIFVSGDGDGALIDLVAAASADFDHAKIIHLIVSQPGIGALFEKLQSIDARAREADAAGKRFDFVHAYDEIEGALQGLGLIEAMRKQLRPSVVLSLQTRHAEHFATKTALLNRLAAYLVIKACLEDEHAAFSHYICDSVEFSKPPVIQYEAKTWLKCGDQYVGANAIYVRRGPDRLSVRKAFEPLIGKYADEHTKWLKGFAETSLVPRLSEAARAKVDERARFYQVPYPEHVLAAIAKKPNRIQFDRYQGQFRWSGTLGQQAVAQTWDAGAELVEIICDTDPASMPRTAAALVRVALHARRASLVVDQALWRDFAENLTSSSAHARELQLPTFAANAAPTGPPSNSTTGTDDAIAATLNGALDAWVLNALDGHLANYLETGADPGHAIDFSVAADLRTEMKNLWSGWRTAFSADQKVLCRFLRLLVCAIDEDASETEAHVIVGRSKLPTLVRATAVALAIGAAWKAMSPSGERPGNLRRTMDKGEPWTGHACAADRIDGRPAVFSAASHTWPTFFVVLPLVSETLEISRLSAESLNKIDTGQPRLDEPPGASCVVLTLDNPLVAALEKGLQAVVDLLEERAAHRVKKFKAMITSK